MATDFFKLTDIDSDTLHDFEASHQDALDSLEHDLFLLEKDPQCPDVIDSIFRTMYSIQGICRMCAIEPFVEYTDILEEVFSELRSGQIIYTPHIQEALLLGFDKLRTDGEDIISMGEIDVAPLSLVKEAFKKLMQARGSDVDVVAAEIIKLIGGDAAENLPLSVHHDEEFSESVVVEQPDIDTDTDTDVDFKYFKMLGELTDEHSPFWQGRTKSHLKTCLGINQLLANPVDTRQLVAASYLHDIGMVFVPNSILQKNDKLNEVEVEKVHQHVVTGYEWIKRISGWQGAAQMVLQHHERVDGQGYPNNTQGSEICMGAKILALADTFYSVTNQRADRTYKRSLVRATAEINACVGSQFDADVVDAFNIMIREIYSKKEG